MARKNSKTPSPLAFTANGRYSPDEVREASEKAVAKILRAPKTAPASIAAPPEIILGYRQGAPLDTALYSAINFDHPRDEAYYSEDNAQCRAVVDSIRASGSIDPLELFLVPGAEGEPSRLALACGATRLYSVARMIEENPEAWPAVPMLVHVAASESEIRAKMVASNLEGRSVPLGPVDIARAIVRLEGWGLTQVEIAQRFGKSETWTNAIRDYKRLLEMPSEIVAAAATGSLAPTNALALARLDPEEALKLFQENPTVTVAQVKKARARRRLEDTPEETAEAEASAAESNGAKPEGKNSELLKKIRGARAAATGEEVAAEPEAAPVPRPRKSRLRPIPRLESAASYIEVELEAYRRELPRGVKGAVKKAADAARSAIRELVKQINEAEAAILAAAESAE